MTKEDEDLLKFLLGGFIGAVIAAPKPQDKQDLESYRRLKQEMTLRQQKVGDLPNIYKLLGSRYNKPFLESYKMYLYGFFRGSIILSTLIIESLLKERYGDKKFYLLIEAAKNNNLMNYTDYHFLQAIRNERNDSAHDLSREITEEDAVIVIRIVNKLLHKFL